MKIIPKFAGGGSTGSFFTVYQAVQNPQIGGYPTSTKTSNSTSDSVTVKDSSKDSSDEKEDTKGKLTEKDLFNMIKDVEGLPNEMKQIITSLKRTMETQNLVGQSAQDISTTYLNALYKIKTAKQNKAKFDEAIKDAKTNGSLGEVAIGMDGELYAQDEKGNPITISLNTYLANKDKYHLLTNSNLAYLRQYNPKLAFMQSDTVFETITNGVGYESFQTLLDKAKSSLGSTSSEEKGIAGQEALAGLRALQGKSDAEKQALLKKANGVLSYDTFQESNVNQVQSLITYLSAVLPKRAKVWAATKFGTDEDSATKALVGQYLMGQLKTTTKYEVSGGSKGSKDSNGSGSSSSGMGDVEYNTPMKLLEGLGVQNTFTLSPGTTRAVQVVANTLPLTDAQGKPIGANKTLSEAVSGEYSGILDIQHATMGGQTIDTSAFNSIIVRDGKINSIDFPCIVKADGTILPNTNPETYKAKQLADRELKRRGIDVTKQADIKKYYKAINLTYQKYKLGEAYNSNGEPTGNWRRFGVINVDANSKALGMGDLEDNPLLKEITDDATIDNLISITKDENFSKKGIISSFTGNYDRFYRGTLWIPLDVNYHAASTGTKTKGEDVYNTEVAQQARDARDNWNNGHSI